MVRTFVDSEKSEVWFNLSDVCKSLGITNNRNVRNRLDEENLISLNLKELHNTVHQMDGISQTDGRGNPNTTFVNESDFGEVRTYTTENNIWFCLKDICRCLEIKNSKDTLSILPKGVATIYPLSTNGGTQQVTFVNESGLYRLIFKSRKEKALQFQDWVTSEVLPSIRK